MKNYKEIKVFHKHLIFEGKCWHCGRHRASEKSLCPANVTIYKKWSNK